MATNIFSPTSGRTYSYGGFNIPQQPVNNIFSGVNPYYINNSNTYVPPTPPEPVAPTPPTAPIQSGGDSFPTNPPQYSQFTGFGFGNNTGYNGPYNQGNPLSDLNSGFNFGGFIDNIGTTISNSITPGGIVGSIFGGPIGGLIGNQVYNNWDKMSFANPLAADQKKTFSTTTAASYKPTVTGTTNGVNNYDSSDPGAVNPDGSVNWNNLGNPSYVTIDGIGVSNPNTGSSSSSSGGSSGGGGAYSSDGSDGITDTGQGYGSYDMGGYGEDVGVSDF